MPRGPIGGATAALIKAVADRGVKVSPYQIERWRAAGELDRPVRHGRGRGRGTASEAPTDETVHKTLALAATSRRGVRRFGAHPIERLARDLPLSDAEVRRAVDDTLIEVGRFLGADYGDGDNGWQARHDLTQRARAQAPVRWGDLLDAVEKKPARPEPSQDRVRAGFAGLVHTIAGHDEALPENVIDLLGVAAGLPETDVNDLHQHLREEQLHGGTSWADAVKAMSLQNFRHIAHQIEPDQWRRALPVFLQVTTYHMFIALAGALDIAGLPVDLGGQLRMDAHVVRQLRADPMWHLADAHMLNPTSRYRAQTLLLGALGMIMADQIDGWEKHLERIVELTGTASGSDGRSDPLRLEPNP